MVYIDRKYLLLVSYRLERFKQLKEDLYNFRCPYCGDSKKKTSKARGYVYKRENDYFYACHNCSMSTTFNKFLSFIDGAQHREYVLEKFVQPNVAKPMTSFLNEGPKPQQEKFKNIEDFYDKSIETLPDGHYAKEYIRARKIPEKFWREFVFAESFKDWMDNNFPGHGKEKLPSDPRIILFYTNFTGGITSVTGRALGDGIRYITIKISDSKKIFGYHRFVDSGDVYVTEGQFDSLFLPNALASGDANLVDLGEYLDRNYLINVTLIWDNTPRNRQIVQQMELAVDNDFRVVMLPYDPDAKDINEMIKGGMTQQEVLDLLKKHTYTDLEASLQLSKWRKC